MGKIMRNGVEFGGAPLPIASQNIIGGVKVGNGLSIAPDGTLNATGGGGGASSLNDLSDVQNIDPYQGEVLVYDSEIGKYINTGLILNRLADVRVTYGTLANGDVLTYDATSGRFVNKPASGGGGGGGAAYSTAYELKVYPADEPFKKYVRFTVPGNFGGDYTLMNKLVLAIQANPFYVIPDGTYSEAVFTYQSCGIGGGGERYQFPPVKRTKTSDDRIFEVGIQLMLVNILYDSENDVSYFDMDFDNTDVKDITDPSNPIVYPVNHQGLDFNMYMANLTVLH